MASVFNAFAAGAGNPSVKAGLAISATNLLIRN